MSLFEKLTPVQKRTVNRLVRGEVAFLSGTVAPAKSDPDTMDIESFAHAMEHYSKRGVESVVIQPKYMGSRCQVYVYRDLEDCYAVSRNGFRINHVDLTEIFKERHDFWFGEGRNKGVQLAIEDGELLPWRCLGDKLVDEQFLRYSNLYRNELNLLEELGLCDSLPEAPKSSEKEQIQINNLVDIPHTRGNLELFDHQVNIFGKKGEPEFYPFNILKVVYKNGREEVWVDDNMSNFEVVGKDPQLELDPSTWQSNEELKTFLKEISDLELEGVMVKPSVFVDSLDKEKNYAPMLKVRNKEYLRIVYGPDYTDPVKLKELVQKKSIGRKVGASRKEYFIGKKLLQIPNGMLQYTNEEYRELVSKAIISNDNNSELDPRL